ncbi:MAG: hypothetical protein JWR80_7455 [Bradyrhizobium sp.]|nr:hypothetical protein [Bradyrhizobium sp.]
MSEENTKDYYIERAAKARSMADLATTPAARAIHLELARGYDTQATRARLASHDDDET